MSADNDVILACDQQPPLASNFDWPPGAEEELHDELEEGFSDQEAQDQTNGNDQEIGDTSVLTEKRINTKRYAWWYQFRQNVDKHKRAVWMPVENDVRPVSWEALVIGEGSPATLHQLARATAWDIRRWAIQSRVPFHDFCLTTTHTRLENIRSQDDETKLAAKVQRWARRKLREALLPVHDENCLTVGYRATKTTTVGLNWSRVWERETGDLAGCKDLQHKKYSKNTSSELQQGNMAIKSHKRNEKTFMPSRRDLVVEEG
ncbi:hypothetical protein FACUT_13924 [Fusarium acutatum]|uniref:Uncharacterized protein n=1 Tax=Fusarium acutatum TaxID=78861 RepID=A0A8H4J903_9HYPO|nr:hypothetical protein FACUT_13924 [Fusarium acutatum]